MMSIPHFSAEMLVIVSLAVVVIAATVLLVFLFLRAAVAGGVRIGMKAHELDKIRARKNAINAVIPEGLAVPEFKSALKLVAVPLVEDVELWCPGQDSK